MSMDFQVAVDKLNAMPVRDLVAEADKLSCDHLRNDAAHCIVANLLRHWTGHDRVYVGPAEDGRGTAEAVFDDGLLDDSPPTANCFALVEHVSELIDVFDEAGMSALRVRADRECES